ncbi:site-specific integrase [Leclercia adecarboxylata]|uniref:site-specific integrase n=1 Tax=Leclercia adecarboxylata TaxID=83655 RepID=UPI0011C130DA|nr:site-specific integrase [Leclercia adecarboxylata]
MRQFSAKRNYILLRDDGTIHYPFSKFLTEEFDNPNTRELVSQSLRILQRFFVAHGIELTVRMLEKRCLTYDEIKRLAGLCYRPLSEIERLSDARVVLITSAKSDTPPENMTGALEANTAAKRLNHIASYLKFYREVFLDPHIQSNTLRGELHTAYDKTQEKLKHFIAGTKQNHYLTIQSLPSHRFLQIIRTVVLDPATLFLTDGGKPSATLYRDRAMFLLACEGLRPGALGNLTRDDFRPNSGHIVLKDNIKQRPGRPTTGTPALKGARSKKVTYASQTMITLWPFTVTAINDYLVKERDPVLAKHLKNRSFSFLFLNEKGQPIKHRATLTSMFHRVGKRLAQLGMLDIGNDPFFKDEKRYEFYAYVLRHSAASLFIELKGTDDGTLDKMKSRFGWTLHSKQPQRYAARALSEQANIELKAFYSQLIDEAHAKGKG